MFATTSRTASGSSRLRSSHATSQGWSFPTSFRSARVGSQASEGLLETRSVTASSGAIRKLSCSRSKSLASRVSLAKDPRDASDFEREQLSFLIAHDDAVTLLVSNNPSLAWLPTLADLKLVGKDQPWLVAWLERNLEEPDAVRDVVANIALLGKTVVDVLDYRLQHLQAPLREPYATAWRLIVRHLKTPGRDVFGSGWFDVQPRLARGERTPDVLEQLVQLLLPQIKVSKRFSLEDHRGETATSFRDLMALDFETDENLDVDEILRFWPPSLPAFD